MGTKDYGMSTMKTVCAASAARAVLAAHADGPALADFDQRAKAGEPLSVAFLGGSITEMDGYRPMVCEFLSARYPKAKFSFLNAGIASTCSTTGAFRLRSDVLDKGSTDLLFVDFVVNDDQDAHHSSEACVRGMEGIVRQFHLANPCGQAVFVYFVNEGMLDTFGKGESPLTIAAHEKVAKAYGVPSVNVAAEVAKRIGAGEFDWDKYGGVHPAPFGNRIAAAMVAELFDAPGAARPPYPQPLDPFSYSGGCFLDLAAAKRSPEWKLHAPDWSGIPGAMRDRFENVEMLEATVPGASLTLEFEGTAVGAYVLAGPDAGMVEASVDRKPPVKVDLLHAYSGGLNYPRTVLFAEGLASGRHTLSLTISAARNSSSKGNAARIMHFVCNGPERSPRASRRT